MIKAGVRKYKRRAMLGAYGRSLYFDSVNISA